MKRLLIKAKLGTSLSHRLRRILLRRMAALVDYVSSREYIDVNMESAKFLLAKRSADSAEGWLKDAEGALLYVLARNCTGKGVIVEIGSWKGRSTIYLGKGSKEGNNVMVYAVDPHKGGYEHTFFGENSTFKEFISNLVNAGVADVVAPIMRTSEEAASNFARPCELIFIDGSHEYQFVKEDFDLWFQKLVDGGIIAFHDTLNWEGPKRVVTEFIFKSRQFKQVRFVQSITFGEKVHDNSRSDRLRNMCVLLLHGFRARLWNAEEAELS